MISGELICGWRGVGWAAVVNQGKKAMSIQSSPVFNRAVCAAKASRAWLARRTPSWLGMAAAIAGLASFAAALGLQHAMGLEPCPLCIFQRVAVLASSAAFLGASIALCKRRPWGAALLALGMAMALGGLALSIKHMHVMWVPQDVSCGPDLEYLMDAFPPTKWLPKVFAGEAECAAAARQLVVGLPIPVWSAVLFLLQIAMGWRAWAKRRSVA